MRFINALPPVGWLIAIVVYVVIAIVVGIAIFNDAKRRQSTFLSLPPWWWAASIAILSPIVGLGIYWLVHYSKLSVETANAEHGRE